MPEDDLIELALAFARAVVKPGGNALVLDATNRRSGWVPIQEAVASGQAFAVEPCDHVVAIDIDDESDRAWAGRVRAGLAPLGCHFVLVNSGREGHQHLWVLMPPGWSYEYLKARMEEVAGATKWSQVRSVATRPPFAPHRLGGRSSIVEPGVATALRLFRAHRPQPISDSFRFGSVWLDPRIRIEKRGQVDRGRTIHRVALMLVNARRSQQDFETLIRADENDVTSKYWNMPSDRRQPAVDLWWKRACEYVRANPPTAADRGVVEGLMDDVPVMDWRSRSGANDRAVYQSLLETGHKAGSLTVDASIRRLSELTNLSTGGVQAALGRLVGRCQAV